MSPAAAPPAAAARARRLRAPLLVALAALLAFESAGGLVIFFARLAAGTTPGEALHVVGGLALALVYALYQLGHWRRVAPFRSRLDYALGLLAAGSLVLALASGLALGAAWWNARLDGTGLTNYAPSVSALHNVTSMLVLTFVGAHLAAVLRRTTVRPD